jgi:predicted DNA-binding transcriptional regulator AlpA
MRLLSYEQLAPVKGITMSKATIRRRELAGTFPRHLHPSPGKKAWAETELDEYLANLIVQRDGTTTARG